MGETDVYFGEVKVVDDTHAVIQKVFVEINLESFSKLYGARVFVDQIQLTWLDNMWQAVIADKIYLVCKDFSPCSQSFYINESEALAGSGSRLSGSLPNMINQTGKKKGVQIHLTLCSLQVT